MPLLNRLRPDPFVLALLTTVGIASLLPCAGAGAHVFALATDLAVALLFFLYGARLSRQVVVQGATRWRLHATVFFSTFLLFPLFGLALSPLSMRMLTPDLYLGTLFLCTLPSTIQSSIAFTSIAGGNVPAAICSASASNTIGIFLSPLLVGVMMQAHGATLSFHAVEGIVAQLVAPFILGQIARPWLGAWAERNRRTLSLVDRGVILLVVYTAFSAAVVQGIWRNLGAIGLAMVVIVDMLLLTLVLIATTLGSRRLGYSREDEIAVVFCGSKKSLASGIPMANVLFVGHTIGMVVLPLMLFHQIQLIVCAFLARRYAARGAALAQASAKAAA